MKNEDNQEMRGPPSLDVIFDVTEDQMASLKDVMPNEKSAEISQLDGQLPEWAKTVLLKYSMMNFNRNDRNNYSNG